MTRAEIERLLPAIFQRTLHAGSPLAAILEVMEALPAPSEAILADIDAVFDVYRTPDRFVPFLARWLDLERLFDEYTDRGEVLRSGRPPISTGLGRLRELVAVAPRLSQWRGTKRGLLLFLETATGTRGFEIDEQVLDAGGRPRPFHIRVRAPASVARHRALIERILDQDKPASVTYNLEFGSNTGGT